MDLIGFITFAIRQEMQSWFSTLKCISLTLSCLQVASLANLVSSALLRTLNYVTCSTFTTILYGRLYKGGPICRGNVPSWPFCNRCANFDGYKTKLKEASINIYWLEWMEHIFIYLSHLGLDDNVNADVLNLLHLFRSWYVRYYTSMSCIPLMHDW